MLIVAMFLLFSCSDKEAPTIAITYPANNSEFVQGTFITISAVAYDNEEVKEVKFYIDGTLVSLDEEEPYEYEWNTSNTRDTHHTIYAKAYDTNDNNSTSDVITVTLINDGSGTVIDIDGNVYQTIIIGNQEWMMENLKVTHYKNGDPIPTGYSHSEWADLSTGAFCIYDDNPSNLETYGALYNWYAVDDPRGIAPAGCHIPTDAEIMELEMYLGMSESEANSMGLRGTNEGSKLAGRADLWFNGELVNNAEFGTSGFCALPGGLHHTNGYSYYMGLTGYFWSSTEYIDNNFVRVWIRSLYCEYSEVSRFYEVKKCGLSVRCIKD